MRLEEVQLVRQHLVGEQVAVGGSYVVGGRQAAERRPGKVLQVPAAGVTIGQCGASVSR